MPIAGARDRALLLKSLYGFSELDVDSLLLLAESSRTRSFRRGEVMMHEKDGSIGAVYMLIRGQVSITRMGRMITESKRGGTVGMLSLLADDENGITALCKEDTWAIEFPSEVLLRSFELDFSLLRNAFRQMARTTLQMRDQLPRRSSSTDSETISPGVWRDEPWSLVERIIEARRVPLFANSNLDAVIDAIGRSREIRGLAGDLLWQCGDPSTHFLRVNYGRFCCTNADGKSTIIGAPFALGNMDSLADWPRAYSVRADTDYIAFRTEFESFLTVLETHFLLARGLLRVIAKMLLNGG